LKDKLESYTKKQVNNDQIKKINYQNIVDDKMDAILKDIKEQENDNRSKNIKYASKEEIKSLETDVTAIRLEYKKIIENTEIIQLFE
ncbi:8529_t:CDS:2, partial [Gigaspora margarita]